MKDKKDNSDFLSKYLRFLKKFLPWFVALILLALALSWFNSDKPEPFGKIEFIKAAQEKTVESVIIEPNDNSYRLTIKLSGSDLKGKQRAFSVLKDDTFEDLRLGEFLTKYNIRFTVKISRSGTLSLLLIYGPLFLFIFLIFRNLNKQSRAIGKANKFTDATPRNKIGSKVMFKDVAGLKEAKEELQEIIDFLKNPTQFSRLGGRVPRGVLLAGPTGSGKTLLARAVAGEAGASFLSMSGSEFVEMFVGVGARRVRDLFAQAKKSPPAIIFIDEIDAVGRSRGMGLGGGHDEREQTLNQILVEMDGFEQREGIIILAATNRPDMLDKAILRPGRFDRKVFTNLPDIEDRESILRVHTRNKPLASNVDLKIISRGTPGFSGADLENLTNEAALRAARKQKNEIEMKDFEWAKDKVLMGAEKKIIITEKEKRTTAYHEAGHALTALFCTEADPLHKVSIIPRGQALGMTVQLPLLDKYTYSKEYLESKLTILMGGRAAEKIFLNQLTTGASNDIEVATAIARRMICNFGMSDLGPLSFGRKEGEVFLGRDFVQAQDYSEDTAKKIDEEVKKMMDAAHQKAQNILEGNKDKIEILVKLLLEKETLDGEEIKKSLNI